MGTGMKKVPNMIGSYQFELCPRCKGLGKQMAEEGSGEHRIAASMGTMKKYFDREERK
jgi:hypothetical protein